MQANAFLRSKINSLSVAKRVYRLGLSIIFVYTIKRASALYLVRKFQLTTDEFAKLKTRSITLESIINNRYVGKIPPGGSDISVLSNITDANSTLAKTALQFATASPLEDAAKVVGFNVAIELIPEPVGNVLAQHAHHAIVASVGLVKTTFRLTMGGIRDQYGEQRWRVILSGYSSELGNIQEPPELLDDVANMPSFSYFDSFSPTRKFASVCKVLERAKYPDRAAFSDERDFFNNLQFLTEKLPATRREANLILKCLTYMDRFRNRNSRHIYVKLLKCLMMVITNIGHNDLDIYRYRIVYQLYLAMQSNTISYSLYEEIVTKINDNLGIVLPVRDPKILFDKIYGDQIK